MSFELVSRKIALGYFIRDINILNKNELLDYLKELYNLQNCNVIKFKKLSKKKIQNKILLKKFEFFLNVFVEKSNIPLDLINLIYKFTDEQNTFNLELWTQINRSKEIQAARQIFFLNDTIDIELSKKFLLKLYPQFISEIKLLNLDQCKKIFDREINKIMLLNKLPYELREEDHYERQQYLKYLYYTGVNRTKSIFTFVDKLIFDCPNTYLYTDIIK